MTQPIVSEAARGQDAGRESLPHRRRLQGLPRTLVQFVILLACLSAFCMACKFVASHVFRLGGPYDHTIEHGLLGDIRNYAPIVPFLHQYSFVAEHGGSLFQYPAPEGVLYGVLFALPQKETVMYVLIVGTFLVAAGLLGRAMARRQAPMAQTVLFLAITFVCAYPMWYEWQAGNMEIFTFILMATGVWAFLKEQYYLAAILFGCATSLKMYPATLTFLLLSRKQYKALFVEGVTLALVTIASLRYVTPSITYSAIHLAKNIHLYSQGSFLHITRTYIGFDHSLYTIVKLLVFVTIGFTHIPLVAHLYTAAVAIGGLVVYFSLVRKLPIVNQVILLVCGATFLPPGSYDYTLMLLYIPWAMLVILALETQGAAMRGLTAVLTCFAILLAPLSEFIVHATVFGAQIRAAVAFICMCLCLRYPFASSWDRPTARPLTQS